MAPRAHPTAFPLGVALMASLLAIVGVALPLGDQVEALFLSNYAVNLLGQIVAFALLALALDLIWGYGGILSLGHGLYFALGGYLVAMHLVKVSFAVTGTPPDFMLFMGWNEFPVYWYGFESPLYTLALIMGLPALVAFGFGYISFRSRVSGVYFAIITQALVYVAMLLMFRNDTGFGCNNGMTGFVEILGMPLAERSAIVFLAAASCWIAAGVLVGLALLLRSSLGQLLVAVRDDEARLRFLGYDTLWIKLLAFCLSAVLAAVAGMLYVPQVGIVNPRLLSPELSLEIAVWVAIGGRGRLYGAFLGAAVINGLKFWLTGFVPDLWPFIVAGLVLVVVVVFPNGLLDLLQRPQRRVGEVAS
ncbi:MAG: urea ABC transporter permease subunit UrtC [Candidatus Competibacterales bacterium]